MHPSTYASVTAGIFLWRNHSARFYWSAFGSRCIRSSCVDEAPLWIAYRNLQPLADKLARDVGKR